MEIDERRFIKRLKSLIENGTFEDKTILNMLEDEKNLPENKGIAIYGSIIDIENDIDLFLEIEPSKQKGYHFTTFTDFANINEENSAIITSRKGYADSQLMYIPKNGPQKDMNGIGEQRLLID
jgi:hypothetical protein